MTETTSESVPAATKKRGSPLWLDIVSVVLLVLILGFIAAKVMSSSYDTLYIDLEDAVGSSREHVRAQFGEPEKVVTREEFLNLPDGNSVMPGFGEPEFRGFDTIEVYGSRQELKGHRKRAIYLYYDRDGTAVYCDKGKVSGWLFTESKILYQRGEQ